MIQSLLLYLKKHPLLLPFVIFIFTVITLLLMLIPSEQLNTDWEGKLDWLAHFLLFGAWTFLLGLYRLIRLDGRMRLWPVFAAGIVFGLLIELLQYSLPVNRSAELFDLIFDALGSAGAVYLLTYFKKQTGRNIE